MNARRPTRQVQIGNQRTGVVRLGGDAPVVVQTMTVSSTHRVDECVAEINKLATAGAQLVRIAVPARKDTAALAEILNQTTVPIVADVHFHYKRALEAIEAGIHKIRADNRSFTRSGKVVSMSQARCHLLYVSLRVGRERLL